MYSFALTSPTMAVRYENGKGVAILIPEGSEVATDRLPDEQLPSDSSKLIEVRWAGKVVSIFALDLLERGELVEGDED
jgi:hypothetical protein